MSDASPPVTTADTMFVGFNVVAIAVMLTMNAYMVVKRNFPPIAAKNVYLTLLSTIGGSLFIIAGLHVQVHFLHTPGTIFALCSLWYMWLQGLGLSVWMGALLVNMSLLYWVYQQRDRPVDHEKGAKAAATMPAWWKRLALWQLPMLLFCIVATPLGAVEYRRPQNECFFSSFGWLAGMMATSFLYGITYITFIYRMRNMANDNYNETRSTRIAGWILLASWILSFLLALLGWHLTVPGRLAVSSLRLGSVSMYFITRCFRVCYDSFFDPQQALSEFRRRDPNLPRLNDLMDRFETILENKELSKYFLRFAKSKYRDEEVLFYLDILAYQAMESRDARREDGQRMAKLYLSIDGDRHVDVPLRMRTELLRNADSGRRSLWNKVKEYIAVIVEVELRHGFEATEEFQAMKRQVIQEDMQKNSLRKLGFQPSESSEVTEAALAERKMQRRNSSRTMRLKRLFGIGTVAGKRRSTGESVPTPGVPQSPEMSPRT